MLGRTARPILAALTAAVVAAMTALTTSTAAGAADANVGAAGEPTYGPPYHYTTELMGQYRFIPLKDVAMLTREKHGYRFRTGQQDSHLVVTQQNGRLRVVDRGTKSFKKLSPACQRQRVRVGIAAVCRIPDDVTKRRPLLFEVWPRLGNDYTDVSSLPATFAVTVLGDEGHDVARLGAGPDFFNGHSGRDRINGAAGNDWIRAGLGNDVVAAGSGADWIVGMDGNDEISGDEGDDRVYGSEGDDRLRGDAGTDMVSCGTGRDNAWVERGERAVDCETKNYG